MSADFSAGATVDAAATRPSWLWLAPRALGALFLVWLLSRWIADAMWNLVPDEAYYWVWSRHLAASYLDHPPIVAYLIRIGTAILGTSELAVRWPAGLTTAGTVLVLTMAARRLTGDRRAAAFVAIALLVSPMVAVSGSLMTPDAPACFFQAAALAAVLRIFNGGRNAPNWLMFGAFFGLALDSKYTSVLLGLAVLLALVSCAQGRRQFLTPWPWLAAMIAVAAFSPVLFWNARHQWISFQYQLHHGGSGGTSPAWKNLLDYVGGQAAICSPVTLGICLAGLIIYWRRRDNPTPVRLLLWAATTPLVFFAISAARRRAEANWPMFAYFPAIMLYAMYLVQSPSSPRKRLSRVFWAETAVTVSLIFTIVLHAPRLIWTISPNLDSPQWDHLYGWRDLAVDKVEPLRFDSPVRTADYEYASELSFYLPTAPDVRPLADPTRPTAFDFFDDQSSPTSLPRVVLVRRLGKGYDAALPWHPLGADYVYSLVNDFSQYRQGRQIRRSLIEVAERRIP